MEKTYKVTIRQNKFHPSFGFYLGADEKQMTREELSKEIRAASALYMFKWENYPGFSHYIYAYQQGDTFTIYPNGYLLTDEQFQQNVASQQGAGLLFDRVWAYHKR